MKKRAALLTLAFAITALAAPQEMPKGSELRAALFEVARPYVEREAGRAVKFAGSLKRLDNWAFFNGSVVNAAGNKILVGPSESADTVILWKKSGSGWRVVAYIVGMTDTGFEGWADKYGAPEALFPWP